MEKKRVGPGFTDYEYPDGSKKRVEWDYRIREEDDGSFTIYDPGGFVVGGAKDRVSAAKIARQLVINKKKK